jgi:penicillin V acylase-like amidase (Ntn superfamily)
LVIYSPSKILRWILAVQKSLEIVRQPEQLLEPCGVPLKEMKKNKSSSHHSVSAKNGKTINMTKTLFFLGGKSFIRGFSLFLEPIHARSKGW